MTIREQALDSADTFIQDVKEAVNLDYTKHREAIADLYEHGHWNGSYDVCTRLHDKKLPDLRFIQEDEYDQSMDEDEDRPEWDTMICSTDNGYVWYA